jgi:peptidoglycan hydrolase-like protein with peptidoglycan-binding domain
MANYYTSTIQKGAKGDEVKKWQTFLNTQGYNLSVDGDFGDKTYAATTDYQSKNGLTVDGIVGANTWGKAGYSSSPSSTDWSYDNFEYDEFTHDEYEESDAVINAGNNLNDHLANKPGEYTSQWKGQLDELMNQIMNREKFSYNFNEDALYQQYKDKYVQQAKLAMADTMGQAAALTGGYGSSYAQSVGQQAYQGQLDNLNDIVPELYQMALDKYNREGQDLLNQYGLVMDREDMDYGRYRDTVADWQTDRNYLQGVYDSERDFDYSKYVDDRNFEYGKYSDDRNLAYDEYATDKNLSYQQYRDAIADEQWQKEYEESVRQYNEQMAFQREQYEYSKTAGGSGGSGGGSGGGGGGNSGGGNSSGGAYADTLWYATGTTDDKGNPIFRDSKGKTQAFGAGVNPYTGTKNADAKHGTFSNGYQPNNIGGTKLTNSGMSTSITGKSQTIWQANGKYWLWRGDLNRYVEVDVSDLK